METKMDEVCYAYIPADQRGYRSASCKALVQNCPGFNVCPFYKSLNRHAEDVETAYRRIRSLPWALQKRIARIYYFDDFPWRY